MKDEEIVAFAKAGLECIRDYYGGPAYRCAAHLSDGVHLPCVVIASKKTVNDLALRRFEETRNTRLDLFRRRPHSGSGYESVVAAFVAAGNRVNSYDISRLEKSRFALPLARLSEIQGETSMSWTQFVGVMRDGREVSFGTTFLTEFFQMPDGYCANDVARIMPHQRHEGELFRERPFFTCYVDGL